MESPKLSLEAKYSIDRYLSSRVVKAFAFLGIVNIGALLGIYFTVVDTVAENAAKKAITATEKKIAGATKQLDRLSSKTIDGLSTALQSVGEAKSKAETIKKDILNLQELDLEKVGKVVELLNKSTQEIEGLIKASDTLKEETKKVNSATSQVTTNKQKIHSLEAELNDMKNRSVNYKKIIDPDGKGNVGTLKLSGVLIEFGQSITPPENSGTNEKIVHLKNNFGSRPHVVATTYNNEKVLDGYPVIYDVTEKSFRVQVKDQTGAKTTRYKFDAGFSYIAIGFIN